ncbi:MAG TPA: hypothetical protein VL625_06060, partial [Patescibacteria group bacterium]|nr:hypothetical protein [Patescibacteria group bacterium]
RLTHTIVASNVGETLCRNLGLGQESIDLVKAIVYAHDIGHPALCHRGERAINTRMSALGLHWNHDAAGLSVVNDWSRRDAHFNGLNLTLDVLEGLAKRYWHFVDHKPVNIFEHNKSELPDSILEIDKKYDLHLGKNNHIEGQIACLSDWVGYISTDVEDGLLVGEFSVDEILERFPLSAGALAKVKFQQEAPGLGTEERKAAVAHVLCMEIRNFLINDVVTQTEKNLREAQAQGLLNKAEDVRDLGKLMVGFSPEVLKNVKRIDAIGIVRIYEVENTLPASAEQNFQTLFSKRMPYEDFMEEAFDACVSGEMKMRGDWNDRYQAIKASGLPDEEAKKKIAQLVCEYMTCEATDRDVVDFIKANRPQIHAHYAQEPRLLLPG